jgi:HK97 family phage major capsid protein
LQAGSGDGANLVPTILDSASFIEFLDNTMVSVRAGATVLRDLDGILNLPRRDAAISGGWLAESGDAGDTTPSYDQVQLSLKTYGLRVDMSRQLRLQSSMDVESMVARQISMAVALALDKAAMTGPGTGNAPTGLGVQAGVGIQALATINQITWAEAIGLQSDVMTANAFFGNLAYAIHPVLAGDAKSRSRDSGSGRYVMENGEIDGYRTFISAQVADLGAAGANNAIFGDWSSLIIGYWSGIDLMVQNQFDDGRTRLVVFVDADCNVEHAGSFSRTSNP